MNKEHGIQVYGIANCDSVRKARSWLAGKGLTTPFHDFKKKGVDAVKLKTWVDQCGWQKVLNRKGTTWRQLTDEQKSAVVDEPTAIKAMLEQPSLSKRPVIEWSEQRVTVGWDEAMYEQQLP